jgi:dolichol-phosphate mannosyltransferase
MGSRRVLVLVAALNEEEGIGPTLAELREVLVDARFLVADGNSTDRTVEVAKGLGADVYVQSGRGKGQAVSEALIRVG